MKSGVEKRKSEGLAPADGITAACQRRVIPAQEASGLNRAAVRGNHEKRRQRNDTCCAHRSKRHCRCWSLLDEAAGGAALATGRGSAEDCTRISEVQTGGRGGARSGRGNSVVHPCNASAGWAVPQDISPSRFLDSGRARGALMRNARSHAKVEGSSGGRRARRGLASGRGAGSARTSGRTPNPG